MKQFLTPTLCITSLLAGLLLGSSYYYHSPLYPSVAKAVAIVYPTKGNTVTGTVVFTQETDGLHISANLTGLTPGKHGFHIHEFGNCVCDDAKCTGDHFNPTGQPHAGPDATKRHVGDLGNIEADAQGNATYSYVDSVTKLNGPDSIIGRAVIVHADADDLTSQPSGNAGARVGAGVIGICKS